MTNLNFLTEKQAQFSVYYMTVFSLYFQEAIRASRKPS